MKNRLQEQKAVAGFIATAMKRCLPLSMVAALLLGATSVSAQEKPADQWQFDATIYLWGSTLKTTTATGDSILLNFGTILKDLQMTAMGTFGARKGKISMLADVIYLDISDSQKHNGEFLGRPVSGKLKVGLSSWVLNLIGGYNLIDNGNDIFDIAAGARYLDVAVDASFKLNDSKRKLSVGDELWDAVIGIKGRHNYADGHYFNYYADIGGGDAKLTWQAAANFAYDYEKFTGIVGYRYLKWDFGRQNPALNDMVIHGPYMGAKFSF